MNAPMNTLSRQNCGQDFRQNYRPRPLLRFPPWLRSVWVWL